MIAVVGFVRAAKELRLSAMGNHTKADLKIKDPLNLIIWKFARPSASECQGATQSGSAGRT